MTIFPTWLTGPKGERRVFKRAEDVPEGWVDGLHPSVRIVPRIHEDGAREMIKQMEVDAVRGDEEAELSIASDPPDIEMGEEAKAAYAKEVSAPKRKPVAKHK